MEQAEKRRTGKTPQGWSRAGLCPLLLSVLLGLTNTSAGAQSLAQAPDSQVQSASAPNPVLANPLPLPDIPYAAIIGVPMPTPVGIWQDDSGRVWVEIQPCGERLCGQLVWFKWPDGDDGQPLVDLQNRDATLRGRPLLGLTILRDLQRTGDNAWEGGAIYNPEDGIDYRAKMSIADDTTLRVRAYALLPVFGKTKTWTRMR